MDEERMVETGRVEIYVEVNGKVHYRVFGEVTPQDILDALITGILKARQGNASPRIIRGLEEAILEAPSTTTVVH